MPLWATWPLLAIRASQLPPFELLTVAFAVGWALLRAFEPRSPEAVAAGGSSWRRALPVVACAAGLCGSNALFIFAAQAIGAAHANLIAYLWPALTVVIGGTLRLLRVGARQLLGVALGFAGAALIIGASPASVSFAGAALALGSGLAWALYCVYRLWQGNARRGALASGCALSALLCAVLHALLEPAVAPSGSALFAAIGVGLGPLALANLAWDYGLRSGDARLLAVMAYATPVASALLLIAAGLTAATLNLLLASLLILAAGLASSSG